MAELDVAVFQLDRGRAALEKYAVANHLTVRIYGADARPAAEPVNRTLLFDLFSRAYGPGMFVRCARTCLGGSETGSPVVIDEQHGLAVIGSPLVLAGQIVGAAVAGYALTAHLNYREVVRLARDFRLPFDEIWAAMRKELPESRARLPLRAELLGILGNTLLSEHYRSGQLEETSRRLADAAVTKDRFLAVLSHELRTPLTSILGYAVLLRRGQLDAAGTAAALEVIERNARLQTELIGDLLDVSRIISGALRLSAAPTELGPIVEAAAANVHQGARTKGLRLDLTLDRPGVVVSGDPTRLQQIVSNLLVNAIKFTPPGGAVEVRMARKESWVHIVVRDTGVGIHREFLPYVFDRFRQEDTTITRSNDGLGLGLAIVRHLVELHGGSISAESLGEGQGATFTVALPALDDPEALVLGPAVAAGSESSDAPPTLKGVRILLVDDDRDARQLFSRVLQEYDADVRAVASASAARMTLQGWKPHVLVSDIAMPEESGYVLMQGIRRLTPEEGGTIPALALTAYAGADNVQLALSAGFQAHLAKPIQPLTLALAVGELARGIRTS